MSLADFIEADCAGLIDAWADYALVLSQDGSQLTEAQLRNSAADILSAIALDMRTTQDAAQQQTKSRGDNPAPRSPFNHVAHQHAEDWLAHGFSINDVVAEFRALRATVLRRWQKTSPGGAAAFEEMIRFNEAIDQVLAESVQLYTYRTDRTRDLFAGVLAHDLRWPLGAILNSGEVLLHDEGLSPAGVRAVAFVQRGAMRMKRMIDDLLIFTRTRLSQGVGYLVSAGLLPSWGDTVRDTSWLLKETSISDKMLHTPIGYTARPAGIQITAYLATLALIVLLARLLAALKVPRGNRPNC